MNRILDVEYPIVNCYPSTSNALAILQTHSEMEGWIYCNFIQLFNTDEYTIDYFDFDAYNCPFINYGESKRIGRSIPIPAFTFRIPAVGKMKYSLCIKTGKTNLPE